MTSFRTSSVPSGILWPAATCIAVVLVITAAISLRGQHGETLGGGKRDELQEALRQESASPYRWCDLGLCRSEISLNARSAAVEGCRGEVFAIQSTITNEAK